ncbi:MAG: polysaccharide biosynthesis/export family protein [Acidobacteria bacterium]|nr:polysaccharide biosynthesis/export family protein [Acidobacteriota bacterium]
MLGQEKVLMAVMAALLATLGPASLPAQQKQEKPSDPGGVPGTRDAVIGPNDAVTILVLDAEEISKTWRVGPGGDLNLPLIGRRSSRLSFAIRRSRSRWPKPAASRLPSSGQWKSPVLSSCKARKRCWAF